MGKSRKSKKSKKSGNKDSELFEGGDPEIAWYLFMDDYYSRVPDIKFKL